MEEKSRFIVMDKVYINRSSILTPLGLSVDTNWHQLIEGKSGLSKIEKFGHLNNFFAGKIDDNRFRNLIDQINENESYTRLEVFAILTLKDIFLKENITSKTGLFISTTKGNIHQLSTSLEKASISLMAKKIADYFQIKTEPIVVCNACVSGVLAVNTAKRYIEMGLYDDAYVLALDELTDFVLTGFNSFQVMDFEECKPFDINRKGVNLGEAVAAVYISKDKTEKSFQILGEASINDANHISGPSRTGEGLVRSVERALQEANINSSDIDYISAHGTATNYNDEMEAIAFDRLKMNHIPTNSLKSYFGHTLGASGLLEIILAMKQAEENIVLKNLNFSELGTSVSINIPKNNLAKKINIFLKTSSGFGGSNAVIILKKVNHD